MCSGKRAAVLIMRNKITGRAALSLMTALVFTSCYAAGSNSEDTPSDIYENKPFFSYSDGSEAFTAYSFILKGEKNNFYASVTPDGEGSALITLEDSGFVRKSFEIEPPDGYRVVFPDKAKNSSQTVNVIRNDLDDRDLPDLIEIMFRRISEDESIPMTAGKYFAADKDGNLREIAIYDKTGTTGTVKMDWLDRIRLNHTEADKFIYEISVGDVFGKDGGFVPAHERVRIKTMVFDPIQFRFIIDYEPINERSPLYFGYAYLAAANTAARYMTVELMPGISDTEYMETTDEDGFSSYYFLVDSRIHNVSTLKRYMCSIFTNSLTDKLMSEAPQDYRDFGRRLYSLDKVLENDTTLGILTFTDMEISPNTMLFRSRQEEFDESGNFIGYTDGGNFIISTQDSDNWKVVQYRFPYLR